jgi:drug/metabolite transporter (DMT)-like permease
VERRYVLMLAALSAMWASSYLLIKVSIGHLTPEQILFSRVLVGSATIAPFVVRGFGLRATCGYVLRHWWRLLALGLLSMLWTTLAVAWAVHRLDTSLVAVVQSGSPLFVAAIAPFIARTEASGGLRLLGLLVGFSGVALTVGVQPSGDVAAGVVIATTGIGLALNAILAMRWREVVPPAVQAVGYLAVTAVVLVPWTAASPPQAFPGWGPVAAVIGLGVSSGAGSLLYFAIAAGAGASRVILIQYLVPAIAVLYGALFLGESIRATTLIGLAVVLGGVTLASGLWRPARTSAVREAQATRPPS